MGTQFDDRQGTTGRLSVTAGATVILELEGVFDHVNTHVVMAAVDAIPPGDVFLDLSRVACCSPSLVACLLRLERRVTREGHRIEATLSPVVSHLLSTTSTHNPFTPTTAAAGAAPRAGFRSA